MVRVALSFLLVGCSAPAATVVEAGAPAVASTASLPTPAEAGVDLTEVQTSLGKRVDAADRKAAPLRERASHRHDRATAAAVAEVDVLGAAAKLHIATLETPAANVDDARSGVETYEQAVAALGAALDAR